MATSRSSSGSRAAHTSPMPPRPSRRVSVNRPSSLPRRRDRPERGSRARPSRATRRPPRAPASRPAPRSGPGTRRTSRGAARTRPPRRRASSAPRTGAARRREDSPAARWVTSTGSMPRLSRSRATPRRAYTGRAGQGQAHLWGRDFVRVWLGFRQRNDRRRRTRVLPCEPSRSSSSPCSVWPRSPRATSRRRRHRPRAPASRPEAAGRRPGRGRARRGRARRRGDRRAPRTRPRRSAPTGAPSSPAAGRR